MARESVPAVARGELDGANSAAEFVLAEARLIVVIY
jgi:hypothetical protein